MMEFNGYDSSKYSVVTEDGYILEYWKYIGTCEKFVRNRKKIFSI
jgi:hypothetical protein